MTVLNSKRSVFKVVLLGDGGVGKTSLVSRYFDRGFDGNYKVTLGADFNVKRWNQHVIQIWDLAGQELFMPIRRSYYASAIGALLLFDVANTQSFENLDRWVEELTDNIDAPIPVMIVANKIDLRDRNGKCIDQEEAISIANSYRTKYKFPVAYTETSALLGLNIDQIFEDFITWGIVGEEPDTALYHRNIQNCEKEKPPTQEPVPRMPVVPANGKSKQKIIVPIPVIELHKSPGVNLSDTTKSSETLTSLASKTNSPENEM